MRSSLFSVVTQRILVVTDVSGQPTGPTFKDCLTLEYGTGMLSRNVGNYQCTLHNTTEERRSCLHGDGSL